MQMSQPTQMASDHDIMITHTCMHKHTHRETSAQTHTVMSFFLKCLKYQKDKVETGEGVEIGRRI